MKDLIIESFKSNEALYELFKNKMNILIEELLKINKISYHKIEARLKSIESLSTKIDRKNDKYQSIEDITDVVGLRIITYLETDVEMISNLLTAEFNQDVVNSADKRILKVNEFGYRSLHTVLSLSDSRSLLGEYKQFTNIKCEIQIRTILQHAWAEIEHDLGYKGGIIPNPVKRTFNRLAALLETADLEFVRLRDEIDSYKSIVPSLIQETPNQVDINVDSLNVFLSTNHKMLELYSFATDQSLISKGFEFIYSITFEAGFKFFEINTIKEFEDILNEDFYSIKSFIKVFMEKFGVTEVGIPNSILVYIFHYWAAKHEDLEYIARYVSIVPYRIEINDIAQKKFLEVYLESKIINVDQSEGD